MPDDTPPELNDDLFDMLPEGTRIIIRGNKVTFENLPPELLDVALSLNPQDENLKARKENSLPDSNDSAGAQPQTPPKV